MYNNNTYENDEFNRMQNKIKDTIDSMVTNNYAQNINSPQCNDNNNKENEFS